MAYTDDYIERKFRRFQRAAQHANVLGSFSGPYEGGQCKVVIKGANRSAGYRSQYEPVPRYWVFSWRDGKPRWAMTKTHEQVKRIIADLLALGLEGSCRLLPT